MSAALTATGDTELSGSESSAPRSSWSSRSACAERLLRKTTEPATQPTPPTMQRASQMSLLMEPRWIPAVAALCPAHQRWPEISNSERLQRVRSRGADERAHGLRSGRGADGDVSKRQRRVRRQRSFRHGRHGATVDTELRDRRRCSHGLLRRSHQHELVVVRRRLIATRFAAKRDAANEGPRSQAAGSGCRAELQANSQHDDPFSDRARPRPRRSVGPSSRDDRRPRHPA